MTSRVEKMKLILLAVAVAIGAMLLADPVDAHASPAIDPGMVSDAGIFCGRLDIDASPNSFLLEMTKMDGDGLSKDRIVATVAYGITFVCPWHQVDLERAHATFVGGTDQRLHAA